MKRNLSFGSLFTTICAALVGFGASFYAAFTFIGESMDRNGVITEPKFIIGAIGCGLLILFGLVATILAIISIFKKGKKLAIATMVFQGLLVIFAILAMVAGFEIINGTHGEGIIVYGSLFIASFISLFIAYAGAFVLNLFNVLNINKVETKEATTEPVEEKAE